MRVRLNVRSTLMILLVVAIATSAFIISRDESAPYSVKGGGPQGLKAIALLLDDLGYSVAALADVPAEPTTEESVNERGLLVVSLPHVPLTANDLRTLESWAARGNTVLIVGVAPHLYGTLASEYGFMPIVGFLPRQGPIAVESSGSLSSVRTLELAEGARYHILDSERPHVLVSDEAGAVVVQVDQGAGRFIFIADSRIHTNRQIAKAQNVDLLVLTIQASQAERIYMLEPSASPAPASLGAIPTAVVARNHLLAAVLVALWAVGRRLGPPRPVPGSHSELSMTDYIQGVAGLYHRGQARTYALQILYDDFMGMVTAQLPAAAASLTPMERALQLARRRGVDERALQQCLERCEGALQGNPSDSDLVKLAGELESFRQRLVRSRR